jgi:hypothetical protein
MNPKDVPPHLLKKQEDTGTILVAKSKKIKGIVPITIQIGKPPFARLHSRQASVRFENSLVPPLSRDVM